MPSKTTDRASDGQGTCRAISGAADRFGGFFSFNMSVLGLEVQQPRRHEQDEGWLSQEFLGAQIIWLERARGAGRQ